MSLYKCPVPHCDHVCNIFTVNHCESMHNMTKKELIAYYGPPQEIKTDNIIMFPSKKRKNNS